MSVNSRLVTMSAQTQQTSGSTVVAMLTFRSLCLVMWAGDSRLYRLRGGQLEQLTVDHSEAVELAANAENAPSNVITRALGGQPDIELAQLSFEVRDGDRFLMCSDGLHGELGAHDIAELMARQDAAASSEALIARVLQGKAADNVTVVVVNAHAGADSSDTLISEVR